MSIVLKITAAKGKPPKRGIEHYWSIIMDRALADKPFTVADILALSETTRSDVNDFVRRLLKAGIIAPTDNADTFMPTVRQSTAPKVRRDGTVIEGASKQKCLWNAMRSSAFRLGFTADNLTEWGSTDDVKQNRVSVNSYILTLARAGYLIALDKGGPGRLATWRLDPAMDTGPLPPMILRTKMVFDQNRHQVVGGPIDVEEVGP